MLWTKQWVTEITLVHVLRGPTVQTETAQGQDGGGRGRGVKAKIGEAQDTMGVQNGS